MSNQIQPHYVTFQQAKWLKEKEFNTKVISFFDNDKLSEPKDRKVDGFTIYNPINWNTVKPHYYSRPEQHQVVEWLLVNHGIWVYTYPIAPFVTDGEDYPKIVWVSKICSLNQVNFEKFIDADNGLAINHHSSPQEAYSAAFDYIFKELL